MGKQLVKTILICTMIYLVFIEMAAGATPEFRGIWVDAFHDGFKTPEQTTEMVNKVADANLNAIFVQVRKRGDAYYNSDIVLKADDIAADYDPLADIITKAHARSLEVHAWLNLIEVWNTGRNQSGTAPAGHLYSEHPEWMTKIHRGKVVWTEGRVYLDPGHPDVQAHLEAVVTELAEEYSLDGINLGDVMYPSRASGHNDTSVALFKAECEVDTVPGGLDPGWRKWRQDQLTGLLGRIGSSVQEAKPSIKLSVAVRPDLEEARIHFMQDWPAWKQAALVDFVVPMNFRPEPTEFDERLSEAAAYIPGRHIYMGHGSWILSSEEAKRRLGAGRGLRYPGFVLYSYASLLGGDSAEAQLMKDIKAVVMPAKAPIPNMPWKAE